MYLSVILIQSKNQGTTREPSRAIDSGLNWIASIPRNKQHCSLDLCFLKTQMMAYFTMTKLEIEYNHLITPGLSQIWHITRHQMYWSRTRTVHRWTDHIGCTTSTWHTTSSNRRISLTVYCISLWSTAFAARSAASLRKTPRMAFRQCSRSHTIKSVKFTSTQIERHISKST